MQANLVIRNGELIAKEEANISIYNKAFFFDFAVYSNIKVVQGKMFMPELEIEKLFESARIIGLEHNFTKENILEWMKKLIGANKLKDALVRVLLVGAEKDSEPALFLFPVGLTFYPDKLYSQGAKLITFAGERLFPTAKTMDLLLGYVAYKEAVKKDAIDALLIDGQGNIGEGTRSSFFAIKGNTLIMPPKKKVLEGTTRKIISEIAPKILDVKEEDIPLKKIREYDEHFITGTTLNVMPVRQIDEIVLRESAGEKTKVLQKLFEEYCKALAH
ncbi:MAG: aminotransferase class IV family protein [Candidatus Diapherotrites archaeon]|uniref:Aminotransferase class IV family protein n=1 Tax=Candidatus Iainarchaeum sp. TaxID=3101447 RepID=A0A8T4KPH1_9ARCH|nr:aminotransferase class IV family protein [Candidatus Diapherotrites archaeon]